jgi:hypothetical protein
MHRIVSAVAGCALAVALAATAGCTPQQNPGNSWNKSGSSAMGAQSNLDATGSGTYAPPSPAGTVVGGTVDPSRSQALTEYLNAHHLPLVSGRVVSVAGGSPEAILDGYVASEFGKSDAEQKTRTFLNNPNTLVDNRITISPELAGSSGSNSNGGSNGGASPNGSSTADPYASAGSVQDYQNQQQFDPYAAQQQYQYQQQGNNGGSGMTMSPGLGLLLGLLGGSFGGGGVGIGGGGGSFGGGSFGGGGFGAGAGSGFSGYGYPSYPPPSPGFSTFP